MSPSVLPETAPGRTWLVALAALLSGAAALAYEVLWVRRLGELLGTHIHAVEVVLAVFFAGLGLGAWVAGSVADRRGGEGSLFIVLEGLTVASGLLFLPACDLAETRWGDGLTRPLAREALAAVILLVPTLAMGGTIPVLARLAIRHGARASTLGWLYGLNTLGAALGVAVTTFVLLPRLGLRGTTWVAVLGNALAIGCILALGSRARAGASAAQASQRAGRFLVAAALSGFLSVALQLLYTRALSTRFLSTIYCFALVLALQLACLGSGALGLRLLERRGWMTPRTARAMLMAAGCAAIAAVVVLVNLSRPVQATSFAQAQAGELLRALAVLAGPSLLFGLSFPLLATLENVDEARRGSDTGRVYLANSAGACAAALMTGNVLLPFLGLKGAMLACGWVALLAAPLLFRLSPGGAAHTWIALALAFLLTLRVGGDVALWRGSPGDGLLFHEDGRAASISVVETADGDRALKVDNSYRLGNRRSAFAQGRQGALPLLLAERHDSVLAIGLATGGSAGAIAALGPTRTDIVEILPGLVPLLPYFDDGNFGLAARLRAGAAVRIVEEDARFFLRTARGYDVIVADLFIPWRAGEGAMYTLEHFRAALAALAPDGIYCQWLPLYQLAPRELQVVVRTFCEAFPAVEAYWLYWNVEMPALGLVGSAEPLQIAGSPPPERFTRQAERSLLARLDLDDSVDVHSLWICERERLASWSADAPLETRDRPRVEFGAPRSLFHAEPPSRQNLETMLALSEPLGSHVFHLDPAQREAIEVRRTAAADYLRARSLWSLEGDRPRAARTLASALAREPSWEFLRWSLERLEEEAIAAGDTEASAAARAVLERHPAPRSPRDKPR